MPTENTTTDNVGAHQDSWSYPADLSWVRQSDVAIEAVTSSTSIRTRTENGTDPLRLLVAGSRSIRNIGAVRDAIDAAPDKWTSAPLIELVHGDADGVDSIVDDLARRGDIDVDVITTFEPDWSLGGKAGPLRNEEMVRYADALIAVWDGSSNGTRSTIDHALDYGLDVHVVVVSQ